jgi:hypothetical protein
MDLSEMLTIFSPPKAFQGKIDIIQRNAIESWIALGDEVEVILVGDEIGLSDVATEYGVRHIKNIARNELGTPLLDDIFSKVRRTAANDLLCYVNADIIFLDDLIPSVRDIDRQVDSFLVVGQRWDLEIEERLFISTDRSLEFRRRLAEKGQLHRPSGSDYFIFPQGEFCTIPAFALGRAGWDNWMIYAGREARLPVIDATECITVIHQNHDYGHLPNGQPHYGLPETDENISLAGGREMIFTLHDTTWKCEKTGLRKKSLLERGIPRWIETFVYTLLGPGKAARIFRLFYHPISTLRYLYNKNVETSISSSGKF